MARRQGQTLKAYSKPHGLSVSALYTARSMLLRRGVLDERASSAPTFVPVRFPPVGAAFRVHLPNGVGVEVATVGVSASQGRMIAHRARAPCRHAYPQHPDQERPIAAFASVVVRTNEVRGLACGPRRQRLRKVELSPGHRTGVGGAGRAEGLRQSWVLERLADRRAGGRNSTHALVGDPEGSLLDCLIRFVNESDVLPWKRPTSPR